MHRVSLQDLPAQQRGGGCQPCLVHNPSYDFNDELIPIGATYFVRLVERFLAG